MLNNVRVNADHGRDFHPLADHMTLLRNFTTGEIREFSTFPFSLHLRHLIVCLVISQNKKLKKKSKEKPFMYFVVSRQSHLDGINIPVKTRALQV